ncbi:hypothetical protein HELRODRAFT_165401 [Helobdella robusta]|uniref:Uncharacterized protein n=1 Tax=Helobdella robusta TaxID=6412 RepID=T1EWQ2_HELRO|nr:hypothetical protein HELRODRAFT_165401 [Helobdella robusta]ESN91371.1 hypothetical protein HELRODRAFT_165401 [Helobdella robusta]
MLELRPSTKIFYKLLDFTASTSISGSLTLAYFYLLINNTTPTISSAPQLGIKTIVIERSDKCSECKKEKCPARRHTRFNEIVKSIGDTNHVPDCAKIATKIVMVNVKTQAGDTKFLQIHPGSRHTVNPAIHPFEVGKWEDDVSCRILAGEMAQWFKCALSQTSQWLSYTQRI